MATDEAAFRLKLIDDTGASRRAASNFDRLTRSVKRSQTEVSRFTDRGSTGMERFASSGTSVWNIFRGNLLANAVTGVTRRIASLGAQAVRSAGEFVMFGERSRLALQQLAHDGETGEGLFSLAKELSGRFGSDLQDTTKNLQKLLAAQFSTQLSTDIIKMGADLRAIGAGAEEVKSAVVAISQIKGAGRLMGQELLQLANAGVSIQLIREEIGKLEGGKSVAEVIQLQEAGKIGADTAIQGILNAVKKKTGVDALGEAGERFAQTTIEGMIGRARVRGQIAAERVSSAIAVPLNRIFKRGLGFIDEFLGGKRGQARIERFAKSLERGLGFVERQMDLLFSPENIARFNDFADTLEQGFTRAIELGKEFTSGFIGEFSKIDGLDGGRTLLEAWGSPEMRIQIHEFGKEIGQITRNLVELTDAAVELLGWIQKLGSFLPGKGFVGKAMNLAPNLPGMDLLRAGFAVQDFTDQVKSDEAFREAERTKRVKQNLGSPEQTDQAREGGRMVGGAFADGMIAGIGAKQPNVWAQANRLSEAAIDGSRVGMDAHSPSRESFKLGGFFGQGLSGGMLRELPRVERAGVDVAQAPLRSAASSLGGVRQGAAVPSGNTTTVDVGGMSNSIVLPPGSMAGDGERAREIFRQEITKFFGGLSLAGT